MASHPPPSSQQGGCSTFVDGVRGAAGTLAASSKQTFVEIRRAKLAYCVGCCAIFVVSDGVPGETRIARRRTSAPSFPAQVVLVSSVVLTLLEYAPIIFLQEAEGSQGQIDLHIRSDGSSGLQLMNYTQLALSAAQSTQAGEFSYHAPRVSLSASAWAPSACDTRAFAPASNQAADEAAWMYETPDGASCSARIYAAPAADDIEGRPAPSHFSCLPSWCDAEAVAGVSLVLLDTAAEKRMELGRTWSWAGRIPPGQAVIVQDLASLLDLQVGDTMYVRAFMPVTLRHGFASHPPPVSLGETLLNDSSWASAASLHPDVALPITVAGILPSPEGKLGNTVRDAAFMELDAFVPFAAPFLHPAIRQDPSVQGNSTAPRATGQSLLRQAATEVVVNLPPADRIPAYLSSNYDTLQARLTGFTADFVYVTGFTEAEATQPLLGALSGRQFVSLYLGLLLDILLFILFLLSTILIYSLLMINVNARTFELAVRRMLGTTRVGVVGMLVLHALAYSLPAWLLGLLVSQGISALLLGSLASTAGINTGGGLTGRAVGISTALALAIPLVGSIGPIRAALGTSIREALDQDRPKATAVEYKLQRSQDGRVSLPLVAFGLLMTVFGFCIYYLLPLALLSLNLSLFFNIFFWILVGLLLGLVLLALNFEVLLERGLAGLFLSWWEHGAIVKLSLANLIAHRRRNRQTTIMYALSVAFIVFVTVAANQELQSATYAAQQEAGAPLTVRPPAPPDAADMPGSLYLSTMQALDSTLVRLKASGKVKDHAWVTWSFQGTASAEGVEGPDMLNLGRVAGRTVRPRGLSPRFWRATYPQYTEVGTADTRSGLPLAEQYYSARGSQGVSVSSFFALPNVLAAAVGQDVLLQTKGLAGATSPDTTQDAETAGQGSGTFGVARERAGVVTRDRARLHSLMDASSGLSFTAFASGSRTATMSVPSLLQALRARGVVRTPLSLRYSRMVVMPTEEAADPGGLDDIKAQLVQAVGPGGWTVGDVRDSVEDLQQILLVLNFFFSLLTVVALALCFFSLLASMVANIAEQQKEIGILLAVGLRPSHMIRVYVYEAFVLVVSASIMGTIIGVIVAWTFAQQRALFTQLPVVFFFPWANLLTVIVVSAVAALLSSAVPAWRLSKQPITRLLRAG